MVSTAKTLQEESQVTLNSLENIGAFLKDITEGVWENVLSAIATLKLPLDKVQEIYEQIVLEFIENKEFDAARAILRTTPPMIRLKQEKPEKYLRLEKLMSRTSFDPAEVHIPPFDTDYQAYPGGSKENRRKSIAACTFISNLTS